MKNKKSCLFINSFFIVAIFLFHCQQPKERSDVEKTKIMIVQPSVSYLKSIIYLVENKLVEIPGLEFTGVIYKKSKNEFNNLVEFVKDGNYSYIRIQEIEGDLEPGNLYQKNACSQSFYQLFKESDGILFLGGDDISPSVYGQKTSLLTGIDNLYRHYFELSFLFHLLGGYQNKDFIPYLEENPEYVIYGFCLGMQTMNVATGGSMYQDIPHDIYGLNYVEEVLEVGQEKQHKNYWYNILPNENIMRNNFHRIRFVADIPFLNEADLQFNFQPYVYSHHHQAVKEVGKGFNVIATSLDGKVIEAMRHEKYKNVLGVQFHPENRKLYDSEGQKFLRTPKDTAEYNGYERLQGNNSMVFHQRYWGYFSGLFGGEESGNQN